MNRTRWPTRRSSGRLMNGTHPLTRELGVRIIVSDATERALGGLFPLESLPPAENRGFELLFSMNGE